MILIPFSFWSQVVPLFCVCSNGPCEPSIVAAKSCSYHQFIVQFVEPSCSQLNANVPLPKLPYVIFGIPNPPAIIPGAGHDPGEAPVPTPKPTPEPALLESSITVHGATVLLNVLYS